MSSYRCLQERFRETIGSRGSHTAFVEPDGTRITYAELGRLSARIHAALAELGVKQGDRVGIFLPKSIDAVAAIFGALEVGATYVPVDPSARVTRAGLIFSDCQARVVFVEEASREQLAAECAKGGHHPVFIELGRKSSGEFPIETAVKRFAVGERETCRSRLSDPAYILYTSGSTGIPKGVVLTHEAGDSFVDWCVQTLPIGSEDRFSMHAPFHFDLSVFDIHATVRLGATGIIIPEDLGKNPKELVRYLHEQRISVWYSVPSVLNLMVNFGGLSEIDLSALKVVLFAGEEYPIVQLRKLVELAPHAAFYNLYGPTETNVCTFYRVPVPIPENQLRPFPIGQVCSNVKGKLDREGDEGELLISGSGVMSGYWNRKKENDEAFLLEGGSRWYRTGDIVREIHRGCYVYVGRRDRMLKKRGFRIEPGEIEACLHRHPEVTRAAVLAAHDEKGEVLVTAFVEPADGKTLSIIALKEFCSKSLPSYMVPDRFKFVEQMPRTSTDKVDFQKLKELLK